MPEAKGKRRFRLYLAAGAAALVLAVAAALAMVAARYDPADLARLLSERVMERTGRELRIDGPVGYSLSLLPRFSAQGVRLQNAPWGSRPDMIVARQIDVQVSLLPLLAGRVEIHGLTLVEPDVLLEVDRDGKGNWQFASSDGADAQGSGDARSGMLRIEHASIERGTARYRNAASGHDLQLALERLEVVARGAAARIEGKGAYNTVPVDIAATLPLDGSKGKTELTIAGAGLRLHAQGTAALAAKDTVADLAFTAEVSDWPAAARLLRTEIGKLPPLEADGNLRVAADSMAIENLAMTLGKSKAQGYARLARADKGRTIDARLHAPVLDLSELTGPAKRGQNKDGRIFSAAPFPLAAVSDLTGKVQVHIGRLQLRDGKSVEAIRLDAAFDQGRIALGPAQVAVEGKPLDLRAHADASSGKSVKLDLAIDGRGISLGALGALLNITGTPQGSPTDIGVRLAGSGNSMRTLVASASGEMRIVAGPGRLRNRTVEFAADVTELIKLLNPAYAAEPYTELECAVIRFPIRQGVARVANGIAVETSKVDIIAAGTIDFRNETLDLGFRTKAASGLGLGLGTLAELGRLRGTFADPDVEADLGNAARTATHIGLAAITGGLSLIASGLLAERVPDNPCKVALGDNAGARTADGGEPGAVESVIGNIRKIFGR